MFFNVVEDALFSPWIFDGRFSGLGNARLLDPSLTAFFASRTCPGHAIRKTMAWAVEQARRRTPIIGGFHSPLEQSVLEVLLTARAPAVAVLARPLAHARLSAAWRDALEAGTLAVVSMMETNSRLTEDIASRRNDWVAGRAAKVVVGYASPDGTLAHQIGQWRSEGRVVLVLAGQTQAS